MKHLGSSHELEMAGDDSDGEAGSGDAAASSGDDNVVDADFEEVKDDKKKSA